MSQDKQTEFEALTLPLIEWLNRNANPHATIIINSTSAELVIGEMAVYTEEFLDE